MNVAELMPRHSTEPGGFRGRLQDLLKQLRFAHRLAAAIPEHEVVRCGTLRSNTMFSEPRDRKRSEWNRSTRLLRFGQLELPLENRLAHREGADLEVE